MTDEQVVVMPKCAVIRHIGMQADQVMLWAEVDPGASKERRTIYCHGTGHDIPERTDRYICTVIVHSGQLVFHFYEDA